MSSSRHEIRVAPWRVDKRPAECLQCIRGQFADSSPFTKVRDSLTTETNLIHLFKGAVNQFEVVHLLARQFGAKIFHKCRPEIIEIQGHFVWRMYERWKLSELNFR